MASYDSRFAHALARRIAESLSEAHNALGSGTHIIRHDAAATGMACAKLMGEIAGLKRALAAIKEVEEELSGRGPEASKDARPQEQ